MNILYNLNLRLSLYKYLFLEFFFRKRKDKLVIFLRKYFANQKKGFYIDVGCYHPIRLSNTKFLSDKGWRGINIDISKKSIDLFNIARKKDTNLNIGIAEKETFLEGYFKKELYHANTLDNHHSNHFIGQESKKKIIEIKTLDSIINRYAKGKKINLIDIDCEGKDLEVLQGLNLPEHDIELIMIEMHGYDIKTSEKSKKIFEILETNNFKLIHREHQATLIFKKN
mgnify:FL=1